MRARWGAAQLENAMPTKSIDMKLADNKGVILTGPGSVWFSLVRNGSDFHSSGSVNRKRGYGSVSEPGS